MRKLLTTFTVLAFAAFLIIGLCGCPERPAEKPPEPEKPEMTMKDIDAMTVVYLEKKGPYEETGKAMMELFELMKKKEIKERNFPMGFYYDDPTKVDPKETRYEVLSQFVGEFKGDKELKVKEIPAQKVATVLYVGPYEKCMDTYMELYGWIAKNNYEVCGPSMEKYLNDPAKVTPEELKTEIMVPVKEKDKEK
jgi:AraC family transcriptional regulator